MSVDTAAIRLMLLERHQNDGLSNSSYIELRHLTYEFDELRSQLAEQHQQLVLAEVARDASRDAYDATKRELDTLRARLESAEGALRQWKTLHFNDDGTNYMGLSDAASAHFARFGPGGGNG